MDEKPEFHLMKLSETASVLWSPKASQRPHLVLGKFEKEGFKELILQEMEPDSSLRVPYLYQLPVDGIGIKVGLERAVYHY